MSPPNIHDTHNNADHTAPAKGAFVVAPNDTLDLPGCNRALYVGTKGDVHVIMCDGTDVTFYNVQVGSVLPIRVTRVYNTGTTASNILALY